MTTRGSQYFWAPLCLVWIVAGCDDLEPGFFPGFDDPPPEDSDLTGSRRGALPETLDELVPDYLPAVPLDPFDAKPLCYSRINKVVYAVGEDLKDNGGSAERSSRDAMWDTSEPTARIRF